MRGGGGGTVGGADREYLVKIVDKSGVETIEYDATTRLKGREKN